MSDQMTTSATNRELILDLIVRARVAREQEEVEFRTKLFTFLKSSIHRWLNDKTNASLKTTFTLHESFLGELDTENRKRILHDTVAEIASDLNLTIAGQAVAIVKIEMGSLLTKVKVEIDPTRTKI